MRHWTRKLAETWQGLSANLPTLHRDGITFSEDWLLQQLKKRLDSDDLTVEGLALLSHDSTLHLTLHRPVAAHLTLHFDFLAVDWPQRRLTLRYHATGQSASTSLVKRAFVNLLLSTLDYGSAPHLLRQLTQDLDWIDVQQQQLVFHLNRLPSAQRWLERPVFGQPLAARLAIRSLNTSPGQLRLRLGRATPTDTDKEKPC
ncbi:hypothetical protein [Paludibacterium denitrificans]|uniref:Uncharacterized protein n=1 Tax=Paludibacterium denitrificans TaxID=2675226 RepID=A0A844GBK4_9NEIS|nr:hypothetical protein [Paludibacterium denitrificans]MTD33833.1 hypothetical protein [Paludibacterium denitrificans]